MLEFDEKCHDGKEDSIAFGTVGAQSTRMLGTLLGWIEDCNARIKRGNAAWAKVRKWLWRSTLSKRTKAFVIQAVVESTMFFDGNARSWRLSDIKKLQSVADRCYRFIWNNGKSRALIRMQEEKTNSYEVRRQLNITSIRTKIETRCLERIGHVLRMPNNRLTKQVVLGHWKKERRSEGRLNGGILNYWRRIVKETGEDWTNSENSCKDRKSWKAIISKLRKFLREWEESMRKHTRGEEKAQKTQMRITKDLTCRWEGCGKKCRTKTGLVQHERKTQRVDKKAQMPKM